MSADVLCRPVLISHTLESCSSGSALTLLRLIWYRYACVRSSILFSFLQIPCANMLPLVLLVL